jgi:hypothetical protein
VPSIEPEEIIDMHHMFVAGYKKTQLDQWTEHHQ